MAYPISGSPYSGSAASPAYAGVFIPTIWAGKFVEKFYDATVLAAIANTDYEGEIRNMGDTVKIRTRPTISIANYEATQALVVTRPSAPSVDLNINKGKYFNTVLDDVMEVQADADLLSLWADDASEQMKIAVDTDALAYSVWNTGTVAANKGQTAGRLSGDIRLGITTAPAYVNVAAQGTGAGDTNANDRSVIDHLVDMGQVLDEQNIPENGRFVIVPAWYASMIKRSELRDASIAGDGVSMLRNGRLGMVDRFTIYVSNLLPSGVAGGIAAGEFAIYAGHKQGLTFASQMTKVETLRSESTFGTLLRGLQVYGLGVVDGTCLVTSIVAKG
jgi:hypothetical protein